MSRTRVYVSTPSKRGQATWLSTRRALRRVGAEAVCLGPQDTVPAGAPQVLCGGVHVHPHRYGQEPTVPGARYDLPRDARELARFAVARRSSARVLGICRGMQLAVVAAGGSLHQDIWATKGLRRPRRTIFPRKWVYITPGSQLHDVLGVTRVRVNTLHSQAVAVLPSGWTASAIDDHGIVQAVETDGFLGVQWHPEYLARRAAHRSLFDWVATHVTAPEPRPMRVGSFQRVRQLGA